MTLLFSLPVSSLVRTRCLAGWLALCLPACLIFIKILFLPACLPASHSLAHAHSLAHTHLSYTYSLSRALILISTLNGVHVCALLTCNCTTLAIDHCGMTMCIWHPKANHDFCAREVWILNYHAGLLCTLAGLHCFWMYLITNILIKAVSGKKLEDSREAADSEENGAVNDDKKGE